MLPSPDRGRGLFSTPSASRFKRKERPTKSQEPPLRRILRGPLIYLLVVLAGLWIFLGFATRGPQPKLLSLREFEQTALANGEVKSATFLERDHKVAGELRGGSRYETTYPEDYQSDLTKKILAAPNPVDLRTDPQRESFIVSVVLTTILPIVIIVAVLIFLMNQMQGGGGRVMSFGKARAKVVSRDQPKTTFADVAGVHEAVEELMEVKDYLESPAKFQAMGAKVPKGLLLWGPPGTGKTLLARAVAGEAGVPFLSISGSDFVEMFVGVGAARVRDLFEQAKQSAPAIVFIDEIDAVGRHRGAGLGGGHDEREQTLNQLLVEMDGFDSQTGVILMAATNRPDILDPALLRPGRFDRQIVIDRPDLEGRKGVLRVHARGKPLDPSADLEVIARRTPGFTGADLANVINEGALLAARRGKKAITMPELEEAIDRVVAGPERKSRLISEREKKVIAYHEGGHALVAYVLPNADPVHKISVIARGRALGYTLTLPMEDKFLVSRQELIDELAMLLGGRVAEELVFGDMTTGAQNDLDRATKIARQMVTEFGMSDRLGPLTLGHNQDQVFLGRDFASHPEYSQQVAFEIDSEIRELIDQAHDEALEILTEQRARLDAIAAALIDRETIEKEELVELLEGLVKRPQRNGVGAGAGIAVARRSTARRSDAGPEPRPS